MRSTVVFQKKEVVEMKDSRDVFFKYRNLTSFVLEILNSQSFVFGGDVYFSHVIGSI